MDLHLRIVAMTVSIGLFLLVLELVRRRTLLERYALLWLGSALGLVLLSASDSMLQAIADTIGVSYPPSALFAAAFFFIIILLLHFSVAVSRLADQNKVLAQRQALSEERLARLELERSSGGRPEAEEELIPVPEEIR
jgi:hypothetical protein